MEYRDYIQSFQGLYLSARGAKELPLPSLVSSLREPVKRILLIAPHPDDECLMSGLAIRAREEWGTEVYVLPFSFGSNLDRQAERKRELNHSVDVLKFTLVDPRAPLFHELSHELIEEALQSVQPDAILIPHVKDGHPTHIRCSQLSQKAAQNWVSMHQKKIAVFESEFWMGMEKPNLLIPLSSEHLVLMGKALLEHRGEITRNPYHLSLPAFAMEQMRRGSEVVSGMGAKPPYGIFAQIYRHTDLVR